MSDDDLGFRTGPKRKKSKSSESKTSTGERKRSSKGDSRKTKRDSKAVKRPEKSESKGDSKREKRKTGKHAAAKKPKKEKQLPPLEAPSKAPLIAGVAVAVLVVGVIVAVLSREPETAPPAAPETTAILGTEKTVAALPRPSQRTGPALRTKDVKGIEIKVAKPLPVAVPGKKAEPADTSALDALRKKSSTHAAIARVLDELRRLFDPKELANPGPNFEKFKARRKREAELIQQLRDMGALAVDALQEMILGLDHNHSRIVMGKALAGIEGPEASKAIGDILGKIKDVSIQTAIVRNLPETPSAAATIADAFKAETNSTLRSLLLHEYSNRLGNDVPSDVFREAAKDKDINVRATAVTIIGRRGDPNDQALMEEIIRNEKSLMIRQKAILSYALTGGSNSLPTLEGLTRDPQSSLAIRASAVLGISRIGGKSRQDAERAIQALDQIAMSDRHPEIQGRARMAARNLRRSLTRKQQPTNRREPLRVDPGAGPINKR